MFAEHIGIGDAADEAAALFERASDVAKHGAGMVFGFESVVHAEHHAHDVEAAAVHRGRVEADLADNLHVFDAL